MAEDNTKERTMSNGPQWPLYLTDRSAVETDDTCGMKYWWNREHGGTGIMPTAEMIHLTVGKDTHEDFSTIAEAPEIGPAWIASQLQRILDEASVDVMQQQKMERLHRRLGWFAAYATFIEPGLREGWENVGVEHELILDRGDLWIPTTPDRVLRSRKNPNILVYKELKTTITASNAWLDSWKYAIQLHIGMKAVEEELGERMSYSQIMALMKGTERDGRLTHPYVWGYYNRGLDQWTHDYTQARSAAWSPRPVWDYPGGTLEWVIRCGPEVARAQFPHTPPVFLNERMLDEWVVRRRARAAEIEAVKATCASDPLTRAIYFEARTKNCRPAFGSACDYLMACWNASINADPLGRGPFMVREPHHEVEIQWRKARA